MTDFSGDDDILDAALLEDISLDDLEEVIKQLEGQPGQESQTKRSDHLDDVAAEPETTSKVDDHVISDDSRKQTSCVSCGNPKFPERIYGVMICRNCFKFIRRMIRVNFDVHCKGDGDCNTSYAPNKKITCRSCRLKAVLKLDVNHPAWIQYKKRITKTSKREQKEPMSIRKSRMRARKGNPCKICNNCDWITVGSLGFNHCGNCKYFLYRFNSAGSNPKCSTGLFKCSTQFLTREQISQGITICSGCRLKKAIDLGFKNWRTASWMKENNLDKSIVKKLDGQNSPGPVVENTSLSDPVVILSNECSPAGATLGEAISSDSSRQLSVEVNDAIETQAEPPKQPKAIQITCAEDLECPTDKLGLPLDVEHRFSRWLYADLSQFRPGTISSKNPQDEIAPNPVVQVIVFSNDISSKKFPLLTINLNPNERPDVEEIITPTIEMRPSSSLIKAQAAAREKSKSAGDRRNNVGSTQQVTAKKVAKPKLNLTLRIKRTTIDRRPMLKRLKTSCRPMSRSNINSCEVSSTSLIAPGEDCDESDEVEVIEIDCD